jgi:hypothetical protein
MPPGGGGTRPADARQATASCSGGHPPATAASAADTSRPDTNRPDTNRPDTDLLDADRGSGSSSGQPRRPRCPVPQPPRHRPQCPAGAGRRRTRSRRCGATAGPGSRICSSALVKWPGRRSQRRTAVGCVDAGRGLPNTGSPHAPALWTPATAAGHGDTAAAIRLDSRQQDRPPSGSHVRSELDPNVRHRPARPADPRSVVCGRPESQRHPVKAAQARKPAKERAGRTSRTLTASLTEQSKL